MRVEYRSKDRARFCSLLVQMKGSKLIMEALSWIRPFKIVLGFYLLQCWNRNRARCRRGRRLGLGSDDLSRRSLNMNRDLTCWYIWKNCCRTVQQTSLAKSVVAVVEESMIDEANKLFVPHDTFSLMHHMGHSGHH